ncbi:WD40-repeat-containing domain protein [Phaeosphaeriaceae sp. PMI808]|nr:WD40-repeat-containing domain protein [Phaeosphaeriaceae sp. PMI808]
MSSNDYEPSSYLFGYTTPPLSPTKTISTEGCFSPRTPGSPRKTRNCLFTRVRDDDLGSPTFTSPASPTKSKPVLLLAALAIPEILHATSKLDALQSDDNSHPKQDAPIHTDQSSSPFPQGLSRFHSSPALNPNEDPREDWSHPLADNLTPKRLSPKLQKSFRRWSSDSLLVVSNRRLCNTSSCSATVPTDNYGIIPPCSVITSSAEDRHSAAKLSRIPLRQLSSPLRQSQWVMRGGFLQSPRRSQFCRADRYIARRRPHAITRESFELNKPTKCLEIDRIGIGSSSNRDPFGRALHRSGRFNEELHGLREAHSTIARRAGAQRRNANLSHRRNSFTFGTRQISAGAVWTVGGSSAVSGTVIGVPTGRGGMLGSGTNAPLYTSSFLNRADPEAELEAYECRLALALDVDQSNRILQYSATACTPQSATCRSTAPYPKHTWRDGAWIKDGPLTVLDAPQLRDDYYCTLLAYSYTAKCLAVGLGNFVHLWSERSGVETPDSLNTVLSSALDVQHVTSLDFSSEQGAQAILAVGRADGRISLWSPFDSEPRFDATQPKPVSCVSWRPTIVHRPSLRDRAMNVDTEELLVGDEIGHIYFYSVEWPSASQSALFDWHGAMTLLARMVVHTQQICGLCWASDGELFASGSNDNSCFLFEATKVLGPNNISRGALSTPTVREGPNGESIYTMANPSGPVLHISHTAAKHKWTLNAAVKAMAFCPWQRGLLAIGGGSNDRCIHFYHTRSGTCLATIDCAAQVTSLVWSQTRREIAATFGFAQPEHPYRVAVFAWPSCEQIVAVPWWDENRALCAIAYPGGPTGSPRPNEDEDSRSGGDNDGWSRPGVEEGCIVVAASDMAIRFHEIWSDKRGSTRGGGLLGSTAAGLLGGSDILEGLHGITRQGAVIR